MATHSNLILSLKISLLSITVLSIAMLVKVYAPLMSELLLSGVPPLWGSLRSWLTPPYLYVIINFIIITIAASSRYQHMAEETAEEPELVKVPVPVVVEFQQSYGVSQVYLEAAEEDIVVKSEVEVGNEGVMEDLVVVEEEAKVVEEEVVVVGGEDEIGIEVANQMQIWTESVEAPVKYSIRKEKPPVSGRFGNRKFPKGNPEAGKSLKVSKPKRQDTLESTWKMITEGRSMPLARHLKKSDTWDTHGNAPKAEQVKKSETFNSRNNVSSAEPGEVSKSDNVPSSSLTRSQGSGSMKLRKEPSLSQDDLNRRVEAFINKFNEEMRLQRLESLNRYKEMVV